MYLKETKKAGGDRNSDLEDFINLQSSLTNRTVGVREVYQKGLILYLSIVLSELSSIIFITEK